MKQKINGWDVLETELKKVSGVEKIVAELFGDGFEIETIADGTYLLNSDEVEELLQKLDLPYKTRISFLSSIITGRIRYDITVDIESFQKLFQQTVNASEIEVPCLDLEKLRHFIPGTEFDRFIAKKADKFLKMNLPAGSCALKVTANTIPGLHNNCLIIVNPESAADSIFLILDVHNNFVLQNSVPAYSKWYIPVLQINFTSL